MKEIIDVQIGDVRSGRNNVMLKSKAIGPCIAVIAYDAANSIGAMAHIMLPGAAPIDKRNEEKTKYAADAIDAMFSRMTQLGSEDNGIEIVLVGGANVLNRKDDTICRDNIESVTELLNRRNLKIKAQAVGGTDRRSVSFDIEQGAVLCTEGNGSEVLLWKAGKWTREQVIIPAETKTKKSPLNNSSKPSINNCVQANSN